MNASITELRAEARTLAIGLLVAQGVALLATPILTRLYSPTDFGVYALFLSVTATLAPVAALRLDAAVVLPEQREDAALLVRLGLMAGLGVALVAAIPLLLGAELFGEQFASGSPMRVIFGWLPLALLLAACFQIGAAWQVREANGQRASAGRAAQGLGTATAQLLAWVSRIPGPGLILGDLVGRALAAAIVLPSAWRAGVGARAVGAARAVAQRYRGFTTYASAAALLNALNGALPVLAVGVVFGVRATGLLLVAQRVASLPTTLMGSPVSQVFARHLARTSGAAKREELFQATLLTVAKTSALPFAAIALLSPFAFGPAFGAEWREAGLAAAVLVPFYAAQLLSAATIAAVDVLQLHRQRLLRELIYLVGALAVVFIAIQFADALLPLLMLLSGFGVLFYAASLVWIQRRLRAETA